jgi:hypothetical protein
MTIAVGQLLASGDLLDATEFCKRAGLSLDQLQAAVADGRLFYVEKDGLQGYPAFYFDAAVDRRVLESVCKLLGPASGGTKWQFFVTPRGSLALPGKTVGGVLTEDGNPRTPLQALRDGELELVTRVAQALVNG